METGRCDCSLKVLLMMGKMLSVLQTDHGWKHIHLGFYTETGGCDCSLKMLLMMGKMLSVCSANRPWLETHPPRLLHGNRRLRLQLKSAPNDG
jgi:hypothetical protein